MLWNKTESTKTSIIFVNVNSAKYYTSESSMIIHENYNLPIQKMVLNWDALGEGIFDGVWVDPPWMISKWQDGCKGRNEKIKQILAYKGGFSLSEARSYLTAKIDFRTRRKLSQPIYIYIDKSYSTRGRKKSFLRPHSVEAALLQGRPRTAQI